VAAVHWAVHLAEALLLVAAISRRHCYHIYFLFVLFKLNNTGILLHLFLGLSRIHYP
jgi:hypothetical protein